MNQSATAVAVQQGVKLNYTLKSRFNLKRPGSNWTSGFRQLVSKLAKKLILGTTNMSGVKESSRLLLSQLNVKPLSEYIIRDSSPRRMRLFNVTPKG